MQQQAVPSPDPVAHLTAPMPALAAALVAVLTWSSALVGIGFALRSISPGQLVLLRFLVASACFAALAMLGQVRLPERRDIPALVLLGFVGQVVYQLALSVAQTSITAGTAGVLTALIPAFAALLAIPVLGERLSGRGWWGMALAFVGAALAATGTGGSVRFEPMGLLALGAAAASATYFVFQKAWLARYGALSMVAYGVWTGAAAMLVLAPGLPRTLAVATTPALLAALYLGVVPTALGHALWAYALARAPAGRVSSLLYLQPIAAFAFAWPLLGEVPTATTMFGAVAVLGGVMLVNIAAGSQLPPKRRSRVISMMNRHDAGEGGA